MRPQMLFHGGTRLGVHDSSQLFKCFSIFMFSSKADTHTIRRKFAPLNPQAITLRPNQITTKRPCLPCLSKHENSLISSYTLSICSLLCSHVGEKPNFDYLLDEFKDKLDSELVLRILMNYRQLGRLKTLEFFSWAGTQMGYQFHEHVVEYMVDFLGRRKLFDDLKCLLITVSSNNSQVSCRTLAICIRFLGRQGRFEEALCLFEEMESKFNCKPDNLVYNNMLYVLCKKEGSVQLLDLAITIFRRIELPDTYSYSNVLVGLCKCGWLETALELFNEMCQSGTLPTRSAVNTLIQGLCSFSAKDGAIEKVNVKHHRRPYTILVPNVGTMSNAVEPAVIMFWKIYEMGLLPSAFVIQRLISEICRLGKMKEAVGILNVIEQRKVTCTEESYTVIIKALCTHNQVAEVSQLFRRMLSHGIKPKLVIYNSIICMLCKMGSITDAEWVFKIMNKNRCLPDCVTYTAMIHAYGKVFNWEAAHALFIEMLGMGLYPHFHTYNLVDKLVREHEQVHLSIKLKEKMEFQGLLKDCKEGQLDSAYEKMKSMLDMGMHPPMYIKDAFEQAFEKAGKLKIGHQLLEEIVVREPKSKEARALQK